VIKYVDKYASKQASTTTRAAVSTVPFMASQKSLSKYTGTLRYLTNTVTPSVCSCTVQAAVAKCANHTRVAVEVGSDKRYRSDKIMILYIAQNI